MSDKVVTLELSKEFAHFLESVHRQHNIDQLASSNAVNLPSIALDPGETTGVAIFDGNRHITVYQEETKELGLSYDWLEQVLEKGPEYQFTMGEDQYRGGFNHIRYEDYRIYEWKSADHSWSQVHTLRWIGAIEVLAYKWGIDISNCMAQHAKKFWTDEKLKHFGLYPTGLKHGKDALRHLLYYLLYPTKVD
jgi:hypothetical protein